MYVALILFTQVYTYNPGTFYFNLQTAAQCQIAYYTH